MRARPLVTITNDDRRHEFKSLVPAVRNDGSLACGVTVSQHQVCRSMAVLYYNITDTCSVNFGYQKYVILQNSNIFFRQAGNSLPPLTEENFGLLGFAKICESCLKLVWVIRTFGCPYYV